MGGSPSYLVCLCNMHMIYIYIYIYIYIHLYIYGQDLQYTYWLHIYIYIYLLIYPIELSLKHDSPSQASNDGGQFCLELHNPFFSTGFLMERTSMISTK